MKPQGIARENCSTELDERLSGHRILSFNNPDLRLWITKALEYNTVNLEKQGVAFPDKLRMLRDPPRQQPRRDKPAKKQRFGGMVVAMRRRRR